MGTRGGETRDMGNTGLTQLHPTHDFFKLLCFLKKTVANKLLKGTTGTVWYIKRHHAEQFINLQYFPVVV